MRTFYIFKINPEYYQTNKQDPYNLYMALNGIYRCPLKDVHTVYSIYDILHTNFKNEEINRLYEALKGNDNYQVYNHVHTYCDYFRGETSKLIVHRSYLFLKSNKDIPFFFAKLGHIDNLFVCDFTTGDYFWLNEVLNIALVH